MQLHSLDIDKRKKKMFMLELFQIIMENIQGLRQSGLIFQRVQSGSEGVRDSSPGLRESEDPVRV